MGRGRFESGTTRSTSRGPAGREPASSSEAELEAVCRRRRRLPSAAAAPPAVLHVSATERRGRLRRPAGAASAGRPLTFRPHAADDPRLKASLTRATVDGDKLFLISTSSDTACSRAGRRPRSRRCSTDALQRRRSLPSWPSFRSPRCSATVTSSQRLGQVVDGAGAGAASAVAWWDAAGDRSANEAADRLAEFTVSVSAAGDAPAGACRAIDWPAQACPTGDDGFRCSSSPRTTWRSARSTRNRRQASCGEPWLLARVTGERLWVGPHFRPGETACWECLAVRLEGNRQVERYLRRKDGAVRTRVARPADALEHGPASVRPSSPRSSRRSLATGSRRFDGAIWSRSTSRPSSRSGTPVIRQPHCPVCGDPALLARPHSERIDLQAAPEALHGRRRSPRRVARGDLCAPAQPREPAHRRRHLGDLRRRSATTASPTATRPVTTSR